MNIPQENTRSKRPRLAVIGGGLAGIAAAESAVNRGYEVDVFEWSHVLGGRVASIFEPNVARWIDNGQHILLGCNTELLALHARLGLQEEFDRYDSLTFYAQDNKNWTLASSTYMPLRWQMAPSFLKMPFLTFRERLTTGLALRKLAKLGKRKIDEGKNPDSAKKLGDWLRAEGASQNSIERFWSPVVFSGLCETIDSASLHAAGKIVRDSFFSGREAIALHLPRKPLREIYHHRIASALEQAGVRIHFGARAARFELDPSDSKVENLVLNGERTLKFDKYILAIPHFRARRVLSDSGLDDFAESLKLDRFEPGAITTIHLWFNRRILPPEIHQVATLGEPGQWLYCPKYEHSAPGATIGGVYHLVSIGASHRLLSEEELMPRGKSLLLERLISQLKSLFPHEFTTGNEPLKLLHSRITTSFEAVFSPAPEIYSDRPDQSSPLENLALAGDWTQTDWCSCMEGAVWSGRKAIEFLQ